jgi:hypothetical protein
MVFTEAAGEFAELAREVSAVSAVVRDLEDQAANYELYQGQESCTQQAELRSIIDGIVYALRDLEALARKYSSLSTPQKSNWDRLRLPTGKIHDIRSRLDFHTSLAHTILSGQTNRRIAHIERSGQADNATLTRIERAVQDLIKNFKDDGRSASVVSDEGWNLWTELEREMGVEGYPAEVLQRYRGQVKQKFLNLLQDAHLQYIVLSDEPGITDVENGALIKSIGLRLLPWIDSFSRRVESLPHSTKRVSAAACRAITVFCILFLLFLAIKASFTHSLHGVGSEDGIRRDRRCQTQDCDFTRETGMMSITSDQSIRPQQSIDFHIESLSPCPVPEQGICHRATDFINFETGNADMIGIRAAYGITHKPITGISNLESIVLMASSDRLGVPDFIPLLDVALTLYYEPIFPDKHVPWAAVLEPYFDTHKLTNLTGFQVLWDCRSNETSFLESMGVNFVGRMFKFNTTYDFAAYRGKGAWWMQNQIDEWFSTIALEPGIQSWFSTDPFAIALG